MAFRHAEALKIGGGNTQLDADGGAAFGDIAVGGGYGSTGVTISSAGVIQADGAATFGGLVNFASGQNYGTYTGTGTGVTNVASITNQTWSWYRIGTKVHVFGLAVITPTAGSTSTSARFALPIASNLAGTSDLAGNGTVIGGAVRASIRPDTTNDQALFEFTSVGTGVHNIEFEFSYTII